MFGGPPFFLRTCKSLVKHEHATCLGPGNPLQLEALLTEGGKSMVYPRLQIGELSVPVPIVQGGMGVGISLSGLAAAVANQGGIGVIAGAMVGIEEPDIGTDSTRANCRALQREIRRARTMSSGVLGVNIMAALSDFAELARTAIAEGIDIIFVGAGLPLDLPAFLTAGAKTKLAPIVSSARAAHLICKKWLKNFRRLPDAVVVEGPKAGGHLGFKPDQIDDPAFALERLVPEVVDALKQVTGDGAPAVPVIAAGGVYTGGDIHRMLGLGAAAVQMGTRFVATDECDADPAFKQAYVNATPEDIVVIESPVGLPGRAIRSPFIEAVKAGRKKPFHCPYHCIKSCKGQQSPYCIALALAGARRGKLTNGFAFAGANAHRVTQIVPVKALMDSLREEFALAAAQPA